MSFCLQVWTEPLYPSRTLGGWGHKDKLPTLLNGDTVDSETMSSLCPDFCSVDLVSPGLNRKSERWPSSRLGQRELRVFQYKGCTALDKGDGVEGRAVRWFSTFKLATCAYTHFCSMYLECPNVCHILLSLPYVCCLIANSSSTRHAILQPAWQVTQWGRPLVWASTLKELKINLLVVF